MCVETAYVDGGDVGDAPHRASFRRVCYIYLGGRVEQEKPVGCELADALSCTPVLHGYGTYTARFHTEANNHTTNITYTNTRINANTKKCICMRTENDYEECR